MERDKRQQQVADFHRRYGTAIPCRIAEAPRSTSVEGLNNDLLYRVASDLLELESELADAFAEDRTDTRMIRGKLMVGELAETIRALANRDEVELADGLADLDYVVNGTAESYLIPLGLVHDEVHRSNMTKSTVQQSVANHTGDKGKGPGYSPPRIAEAIEAGRSVESTYPRPDTWPRGSEINTRDGRRVGNAAVVGWDSDGSHVSILTDYGNSMRLTPREAAELYYSEPRDSRRTKLPDND